jgi:pyochelin biosynthetic protein PchC
MTVAQGSTEWVRRFHPAADPRARLVCFPHAGGSASYFFAVSRAMGPSVEVLCLQYPGRQDRRFEPCLDTVEAYADHITAALLPWTDLPLVFFGHSLGATIAFETARRLQSAGVEVTGLFASGRRGPTAERDERVHERPDDGLLAEVRRLSGTDGTVLDDHEIVRMILPALRADYRAAETYRHTPGQLLRCPVTVLVGDCDPKVSVDEAQDWAAHTTGHFDLKVFAGGHFFLQEHQQQILAVISEHLDAIV